MSNAGKIIQMLAKSPMILVFALIFSGCEQSSKTVTTNTAIETKKSQENDGPSVEGEFDESNPSPEIKIKRFTRIFCEPGGADGASHLFTLRSDENLKSLPVKIRFFDEAGTELRNLDSFKLLRSNGEIGFGLLGQRFGPKIDNLQSFRIYSAEVDYAKRTGNVISISQSYSIPDDIEQALEKLGHRTSYFGISREFSYALIPEQKSFTLRDMRTFRILNRLEISPEKYFNPTLSENGLWAFFTTRENTGIRQVQVSLITGQIFAFPWHKETDVQFSPRWIDGGDAILWLEQQGSAKVIFAATQEELAAGKSRMIRKLTDLPLSSITTFIKKGVLHVVWTDESYTQSADNKKYLSSGVLKMMTYGLDSGLDGLASVQGFSYPPELLNAHTQLGEKNRVLNYLSYSPWTEEIFASLKPRRGLVSFDTNKRNWKFLSTSGAAFSCTKPILGPEFVLETNR